MESQPIEHITEKEVVDAIRRLKNNKAMDSLEHFKLGGRDLVTFLTEFLNYIVSSKHVSALLKEGIVTPIFKKGDDTDPGNYRGMYNCHTRLTQNTGAYYQQKTQQNLH